MNLSILYFFHFHFHFHFHFAKEGENLCANSSELSKLSCVWRENELIDAMIIFISY
jgi:hypothetical protein